MESIHVPATTVHRIATVVQWIAPYIVAGIITLCGFGSRWIISRTSIDEVKQEIRLSDVKEIAEAGQRLGTHCDSIVQLHDAQIQELGKTIVLIWADSEVDRAYSRSPRRSEYIESARKFYAREYQAQLKSNPTNPALALEITRSVEWQPGSR
jgi:hypothetical protein